MLPGDDIAPWRHRNNGFVDKEGKFSIFWIREDQGSLYAFKDGDDRYALVHDARRGTAEVHLELAKGKSIRGRIEGAVGGLAYRASQGTLWRFFRTAKDGSFHLRGLPPGWWRIEEAGYGEEPDGTAHDVEAGAEELVLR